MYNIKKLTLSLMAVGTFALALPAFADSSASQGADTSTTTGLNWNPAAPTFTAGKIDLKPADISLTGGSVSTPSGYGFTAQATAQVPITIWGSKDPDYEYHKGFYVDPGAAVRVDAINNGGSGNPTTVSRVDVEAGGVGVYHLQAANLHSTPKDQAEYDALINSFKPLMETLVSKLKHEEKESKEEFFRRNEELKRYAEKYLIEIFNHSPALQAAVARKFHCHSDDSAPNCAAESFERAAGTIAYTAVEFANSHRPNEAAEFVLKDLAESAQARTSEASSSVELDVLHAGYRYDNNKLLGTTQNGAKLTPIKVGFEAAFKVNDVVNVKFCGAADPGTFTVGENSGVSFIESSVSGCVAVTAGPLPTVTAKGSAVYHWNTDTIAGNPGNNGGVMARGTIAMSKDIAGIVTPEVAYTHEIQQAGNGNVIPVNMFTGTVAAW